MLVDKPAGCTSFDVVREVRRGARTKVGHAGTLDPFATGLLLVLAGQATRLSELLMNLPKEYVTEAQFGFVSSTQDSTGVLIDTESARVTSLQVNAALDQFRGDIRQRVPLTSAVKVDGEPLYKRAHRGETAERPVREVKVYDLSMTRFDQERQVATIVARTGKGTYVRTIVHELGKALETGAYAAALRRTRSGVFNVHASRRQTSRECGKRAGQGKVCCQFHRPCRFFRGLKSAARRPSGRRMEMNCLPAPKDVSVYLALTASLPCTRGSRGLNLILHALWSSFLNRRHDSADLQIA